MNTGWTADDIALARRLWTSGICSREIGKQLGRSRGAVIGQARRSGFEAPRKPNNPKRARKRTTERAPPPPRQSRAIPLPPQSAASPERTATPTTPPVSLLDLGPMQCRFLFGDGPWEATGYPACGAPTIGRGIPYCEAHARLCFAPEARRK